MRDAKLRAWCYASPMALLRKRFLHSFAADLIDLLGKAIRDRREEELDRIFRGPGCPCPRCVSDREAAAAVNDAGATSPPG